MNPLTDNSCRYAAHLARDLLNKGYLDDPWAEAFAQTPRDLFLPSFYSRTGDSWELMTQDTVGEGRRLQLAYCDVTWVQRLDGPGGASGSPVSSCIQPSLAAQMLTALPLHRGSRVCEIGHGTGWLTALLSHRCNAENVTAIEIDPELAHHAQTTLNELGLKPTLICADGFNGHAERSPYDAIISTAAVTHLPKPWLTQTRPGGRIVTPLRGAIAIVDVHGPGQATGRFLPEPVQILPLRTSQDHALDEPAPDNAPVPESASVIASFRDPRFRFVLGLNDPTIKIDDLGFLEGLLIADDHGSSARVSALTRIHTQGTRDLWAVVGHIQQWWKQAGQPGPADFLIEVDEDAQWARFSRSQPERRWRIR